MNNNTPTTIPTFDRFGWYWQPASWLEGMSPQDVTKATTQATNIDKREDNILKENATQKKKYEAYSSAQQEMINSLYNED